jgi:hypothetical protein
MQIFEQEIADGLAEKIKASAAISYATEASPYSNNSPVDIKHIKSLASYNDNDLYYVQSILVSSSWNKNDDIFDKYEVWSAKHTPEHKPTNLEHDENVIIGHIISNWPITEDGILINENTPVENLPNKYHILTGSVIYKGFSNQDLKERSSKLIAEIENGTKYVSMECFFNGFDYGLIDKSTGEYKILTRNNETAYLTRHLRAYGGVGEHQNYKIGRVLRNITFSGKGFVNKPANPDSIIFTKELISEGSKIFTEKSEELLTAGVSNDQLTNNVENNTMSLDLEPIMTEVAEIKNKLEALQGLSEAFTAATTLKDKTVELEGAIKAHEEKITELTSALELANTEKEEAAKKKSEEDMVKEEDMKKVKSELDAANEIIAAYKNKEEEMAKKEKKMKRMASLIEAGIDNDTASATVDKFESLDDEAFAAMTSLFAGKMPPWLKKEEEAKEEEDMKDKKKASEAEAADPAILETAEVEEEVNLGVGGEVDSSAENTRAALVEFVYSRLGKNLKN